MNGTLSQILLMVVITTCASACTRSNAPPAQNAQRVFQQYIEAANQHDLNSVSELTAEDAIWYLGTDTLVGREEVLRPLAFDEGARTVLEASNIVVRGDTVDFEVLERNDVLLALEIEELHHFPRMIIHEGLIYSISARRPPLEQAMFVDSVVAFMQWLHAEEPKAFDRLWPGGKFNFARETGEEMPRLIEQWKNRRE